MTLEERARKAAETAVKAVAQMPPELVESYVRMLAAIYQNAWEDCESEMSSIKEHPNGERGIYMALVGPYGDVFVKVGGFFRAQGGFREDWGKDWKPIVATSVEDARRIACETLPNAKPYMRQAKP